MSHRPPDDRVPGPSEPEAGSDRARIQHSAILGAIWTLIHLSISMPVAFAVNLLLARVLGVADYGRLAFLTAVMEVAGIVISAGMGGALIQFGTKFHASGRPAETAALLSKVQGYQVLVATPFSALAVLILAEVDTTMLVAALLFGVLVPGFLSTASSCLWVENRSADSAKVALVTGLVTQVAVVAAAIVLRTADAVWLARLTVGGLSTVVHLFVISRRYRVAVLKPMLPRRFPAGWWQFALPSAASALVANLVMSRSEVFFLQWWGSAADVGLFALAFGLSIHLFAPAQSLVGPLIPAVSSLRAVDSAAIERAFLRALRASATVSGLLVATAMPAFVALVPALYGDEFAAAVPLVVVLSIATGLVILRSPAMAFVQARLRSTFLLTTNLVALAVDVLVAVAAIPVWGVWGAVAASASATLLSTGIMVDGERRALKIPWTRVLRAVSPTVVGSVVGLAVYLAVPQAIAWWWHAPLAAVVGAAVFLAGLRVFRAGISVEDREALLRVVPRRFLRPALWGMTLLAHAAEIPRSSASRAS